MSRVMRSLAFAMVLSWHTGSAGAGKNEGRGIGFIRPFSAPSLLGEKRMRRISTSPLNLRAQKNGEEENLLEKYKQILADIDSKPVAARKGVNLFSKMFESAKSVKTCETDYDCNPGGRSWPLRCVNVVFSKICVESDDDFGGGRGVMEYALEAIPVRVEDGYYGNGASRL